MTYNPTDVKAVSLGPARPAEGAAAATHVCGKLAHMGGDIMSQRGEADRSLIEAETWVRLHAISQKRNTEWVKDPIGKTKVLYSKNEFGRPTHGSGTTDAFLTAKGFFHAV